MGVPARIDHTKAADGVNEVGKQSHGLPGWAVWLLYRLVPSGNRDVVLGDFAEIYSYIAATEGRSKAQRWYLWQVVRSMPAFFSDGIYFGSVMVGNYFKITVRNLKKRKFFSALNIGGLAIGMAVCLLIFQYVAFETSYDTFHDNSSALYRVNLEGVVEGGAESTSAYTWAKLGIETEANVPDVERVARYHPSYGTITVAYEDEAGHRDVYRENDNAAFVDPSFLELFTFPMLQGDTATVLTPGTLLISTSLAQKYFGDSDPIGKVLDIRAWVSGKYTVTGVLEDPPANSHLSFDLLLPLEDLLQGGQYSRQNGWSWTNFVTYVQLYPGADTDVIGEKITEIIASNTPSDIEENPTLKAELQPVDSIHLYSVWDSNSIGGGSYKTVYFFTIVGLFVLFIAWINYINLSTARAMERAKEVGVRKVVGARKPQVVLQFIFESALINVLSLVVAVGLAMLGLPYLNQLAGVEIASSIWAEPVVWGSILGVFGMGAVLSSLYPAFVLSAFQPITVLKSGLGTLASRDRLRKVLVVSQFVASIALLTGTYAVYTQVDYMRGLDVGYDIDQVLVVRRPGIVENSERYVEARSAFKSEVVRLASVNRVATSSQVPGNGHNMGTSARRESVAVVDASPVQVTWIQEDFVATYGLEIIAGRNFSEDLQADLDDGVLINEWGVQTLGFASNEEAIGQTVVFSGGESTAIIVGVLKDFHWMSAKEEPGVIMFALTRGGGFYSLQVAGGEIDKTLAEVEQIYTEIFPGNPFEYFFADQFFDEQYKADQRFGALFGLFALFALVVACLGLVGLAAYTVAQRTKEIGIRKVLGASSKGIMGLLVMDYVKLIIIALVVTLPIMYFAIDTWLAGFATRMDVSVWLFLVPGLAVLGVALLTVGFHTLRSAMADPVKSLRYE